MPRSSAESEQHPPVYSPGSGADPLRVFDTLVRDGTVEYIHIDAVPRSMSTVLPISLCEAGVVDLEREYLQYDEPLNWRTRNGGFRAVASTILGLQGAKKPITVFEKSTARNVYPPTFDALCAVAKGVVFTVRHPGKQMYSLAERIANDLMHGKGSGNKIVLSELSASGLRTILEKVDTFLALSGHLDGSLPEGENPYMQPSWREIGANFQRAEELGKPTAVVDGTILASRPEPTLRQVCGTLGVPFSPTMVDGWSVVRNKGIFRKDHTNWPSVRTEDGGFANGWIAKATSSTGFQEDTTPSIDPDECPPRMRDYIQGVAIPTYASMISHPNSNTTFL